jgi:hypothetical protein
MKMNKVLISFGMFWIILWCCIGLYHGAIQESYANQMLSFAQHNDLQGYWKLWEEWSWGKVIHSHAINFAFLLILMGFTWPNVKLKEKTKTVLGIAGMVGMIMAAIFGTLQILVPDAIGDLLLLGAFIAFAVGFVKGLREE